MSNVYSATWFELFLQTIPAVQTEAEIDFITRQAPLPHYASVVDLCCGTGRHARLLAERGYQVTGVDVNREAIEQARQAGSTAAYVELDMRRLVELPGTFDAMLSLWQSFGYFDEATNRNVLEQINQKLRPEGRVILDIYHRGFFEARQETRTFVKDGVAVSERKIMAGQRLTVQLSYGDGRGGDTFEWQIYTPEEAQALAEACGFQALLACANFDEVTPPSSALPRMQLVLQTT